MKQKNDAKTLCAFLMENMKELKEAGLAVEPIEGKPLDLSYDIENVIGYKVAFDRSLTLNFSVYGHGKFESEANVNANLTLNVLRHILRKYEFSTADEMRQTMLKRTAKITAKSFANTLNNFDIADYPSEGIDLIRKLIEINDQYLSN